RLNEGDCRPGWRPQRLSGIGIGQGELGWAGAASRGSVDGVSAGASVGGGRNAGLAIGTDEGGTAFEDRRGSGSRGSEGDETAGHRLNGILGGNADHQRIGERCVNGRALIVAAAEGEGESLALESADIGGADARLATLIGDAAVAAAAGID